MNRTLLFYLAIASTLLLSESISAEGQTASPAQPPVVEPKAPATAAPTPPAGLDAKLTSDDAEYGYSKDKPVKLGSPEQFAGPSAERAYLDTLRDEAGKAVAYQRKGSFGLGPDGNVLDGYEVETTTGRTVLIYLDMYHPRNDPAKQLAPKGLYKAK